jgi:hypothetical protein
MALTHTPPLSPLAVVVVAAVVVVFNSACVWVRQAPPSTWTKVLKVLSSATTAEITSRVTTTLCV